MKWIDSFFSFFFLFARYSFGLCNCTVSSPSQCKNRQKIFWKCERSSDLLSNKLRPYLSFVKLQLTLRRGPKVISRRHVRTKVIKELEWPGKMWLCRIFLKKLRDKGVHGPGWDHPLRTLLGNWAHPSPSRPCPVPIRFIPEIFIKNILPSQIFPGHSSSLMT